MPGSVPATSQLDWLSSTTAMIVLFWSRVTSDLLKSFGWGIAALHRENAATKLPFLAARPIRTIGPSRATSTRKRRQSFVRKVSRDACARVKCAGGAAILTIQWFDGDQRHARTLYRNPTRCE